VAEEDFHYLKVLTDHCGDIAGKKILDVGSFYGDFMQHASASGAESWGVEHNEAFRQRSLNKAVPPLDESHYLGMAFSEIPKKHPELKGSFDIIKITAITPYANADELRHMAHTAHFLLKPQGKILLELPWFNFIGKAFNKDQSYADTEQAMTDIGRETQNAARQCQQGSQAAIKQLNAERDLVKTFQQSYRKLFESCFNNVAKCDGLMTAGVETPTLIIGGPKEKIPKLDQIRFNEKTCELAPIRPADRKPLKPDALKEYRKQQEKNRKL